jgi:hypothetical protein
MEAFLFLLLLIVIVFIKNNLEISSDEKPNIEKSKTNIAKSTSKSKTNIEVPVKQQKKSNTIHVTNNYYTQNTVNIQVNNYSSSSKKSKHKDHSEKVWNEMGYKIRYGETYSYRYYGNEIYTPDQVEECGYDYDCDYEESSTNSIKYSATGLARHLLSSTNSKRMTKDILVEEYGCSERYAKKLAGYNNY